MVALRLIGNYAYIVWIFWRAGDRRGRRPQSFAPWMAPPVIAVSVKKHYFCAGLDHAIQQQ